MSASDDVSEAAEEAAYLASQQVHDVSALLERWETLRLTLDLERRVLLETECGPVVAYLSRSAQVRETGDQGSGLYLSAGVHGDEPAGCWGLLEWAEACVDRLKRERLLVIPCFNPWGLARNRRVDSKGRDLNRSFHESEVPVIGAWQKLMRGLPRFRLAVHLHEDYDGRGCYLYELNAPGEAVGPPALAAAGEIIPIDLRKEIDGGTFQEGIFERPTDIEARIEEELDGRLPEAIYLFLKHADIAITFETPSEFSLWRRIRAQRRFLEHVLGWDLGRGSC